MLYDEFLDGTKAIQNKSTYEQYELLEKIYMDCEHVSKDDIYRIWKQTYGKQAKIDRERVIKEIQAMSEYRSVDSATPEQMRIRRTLFQIGTSLTDINAFKAGWNSALTTEDGVTYQLEHYHTVNWHKFYRLIIRFEGKTYTTPLIYQFGDLRIHAA
jgi:hypothetical protein